MRELLSRARLFFLRLRMRAGGIAVWVCPACAEVWYVPAWWRDVNCCCNLLASAPSRPHVNSPACKRLGPRDWARPFGRSESA